MGDNGMDILQGLIDRTTLKATLSDYENFNDKVSRLIKSKRLIGLVRGKYLIKSVQYPKPYSLFQVANGLNGPSYVSFFTALESYGIIPERVNVIESAITKRSKLISTQVGEFQYRNVTKASFHLGINYVSNDGQGYMIASPTKALIDILWTEPVREIMGVDKMLQYLSIDLRIEEADLAKMDSALISECLRLGKKKRTIRLFQKLILKLKKDYD